MRHTEPDVKPDGSRDTLFVFRIANLVTKCNTLAEETT